MQQVDGRSKRRKARESIACQECGASIEVMAGNPKNRRWCSSACAFLGIRKRTQTQAQIVACAECGQPKEIPARYLKKDRGKFCSTVCFKVYRKKQFVLLRVQRRCKGCDKVFEVARSVAQAKGRAASYCTDACYQAHRADLARQRDGEILLNAHGYVEVLVFDHPSVNHRKGGRSTKRVMEHRLVMEKHLGRFLEPWEQVHHKNGIRNDNRLENLELWIGKQPIGHRVADVYMADVERLMLENAQLKRQLAHYETLLAAQAVED